MGLDKRHAKDNQWSFSADEYASLCDALSIFAAQLDEASLENIAQAEARMVTQSLVAASMRPNAERMEMTSSES